MKFKVKIKDFFQKFDLLLLILAWPLIPMLFAEFFIGVQPETQAYFEVYYIALWFIFTVEFAAKLYIAKSKWLYVKSNWVDALVVLSPVFRSLKIFHILRTPILLVSDEVVRFFRSLRFSFVYFFLVTLVVLLIVADIVLFFEGSDPNANIINFEDALWWSFVTFSTVGYGDFYPVTFGGRAIAVMLMILGFSLFGLLVSTAVSFFMNKEDIERENVKALEFMEEVKEEAKINEVLARLDKLEELLKKKD